MAQDQNASENGAATPNIDPAVTQEWIDKIEKLDAKKQSEKGACGNKCKQIEREKREVYKQARADGLKTKSLKHIIADRARVRKSQEEREALEPDELENVEAIEQSLGDFGSTGLGQAAINAAQRRNET